MHLSERQPTHPAPFVYAYVMVLLVFVPALFGPSLAQAVAIIACDILAAYLGVDLFRKAWPRSCMTLSQLWAASWLFLYGSAGILLCLSTGYAYFGPGTTERQILARLCFDVQSTIWFFGGVLFVILGSTLFARAFYIRKA